MNKWIECYQILYALIFIWGLLHIIFHVFVIDLWPLIDVSISFKFCFSSTSCEQIDKISPNFAYAFLSTRSRLGLLPVIFCTFVLDLWSLINSKICFLLISWLGLLPVIFCKIYNRVITLDLCQNFVPTQYLENKWIEYSPNFVYALILTLNWGQNSVSARYHALLLTRSR